MKEENRRILKMQGQSKNSSRHKDQNCLSPTRAACEQPLDLPKGPWPGAATPGKPL